MRDALRCFGADWLRVGGAQAAGNGRPVQSWGSRDCPKRQPMGHLRLPAGRLSRPTTASQHLAAMIHDVDESLRALVKRDALNGARVDVAFDAPTKDWSARQNAPSVNLYLYDIREDLL